MSQYTVFEMYFIFILEADLFFIKLNMNFTIFIIFLTLKLAPGVFNSALSFAFVSLDLLGNEINSQWHSQRY